MSEEIIETATGLGYVDLVEGTGASPKSETSNRSVLDALETRGDAALKQRPVEAQCQRDIAAELAAHGRTAGDSIFIPRARHIRNSSMSTYSGAP